MFSDALGVRGTSMAVRPMVPAPCRVAQTAAAVSDRQTVTHHAKGCHTQRRAVRAAQLVRCVGSCRSLAAFRAVVRIWWWNIGLFIYCVYVS
jgi:hypothetical protein